jgi:MoaA/NifB/PqqE/SkfB family radical SAM enzyme|tara:strand:+ start:4290 stop:5588 length:1299 start_codon:yes stop_codon:yes gene_type:complete
MNKLPDNKAFCTAPWVHIHADPTGQITPCCYWDYTEISKEYGNMNDYDTVEDALNNDAFKKLRNRMLNNEPTHGCNRCIQHHDNGMKQNSLMHWFNSEFNNESVVDIVNNTKEDGEIDVNILYMDIRFRNLCNLKCRMCGYSLSSSWHEENVIMDDNNDNLSRDDMQHHANKPKFISIDVYDKIAPHFATVEEIYFAGGEPLLYPEHVKILQELIDMGRTDVRLKYNSNLSVLKYKTIDLVSLWNKFDSVNIGASIDAVGDVVEYIRTGCTWDTLVENMSYLKKYAPNIKVYPSPTIGILNLETFVDFHRYCMEHDWFGDVMLMPNYITHPDHQNIQILPTWYKEKITNDVHKHQQWLQNNGHKNQTWGFDSILAFMNAGNDKYDYDNKLELLVCLEQMLDTYDKSGNLNWKKSVPHVNAMLDEHKSRLNNT